MSSLTSENARTRIRQLAETYAEHGGDYRLQASQWSTARWTKHLRTGWHLPNPITRHDVFSIVGAAKSPELAEKAFVAVMVWGFGWTGYGPHRVTEMRGSRPEGIGQYMLHVLTEAKTGPVEAYRSMSKNHAVQLGPSYASKIAYFATPNEVSPILDSLVARWVKEHEGRMLFDANKWSTPQYSNFQAYCQELLETACDVVAVDHQTLGLVEYLMFVDQGAAGLPAWAKTI